MPLVLATFVAVFGQAGSAPHEPAVPKVKTSTAGEPTEEVIRVFPSANAFPVFAETWSSVPRGRIERSDARDITEVLERAPSARIQTNSRGETLVFLRNAGERQVSVFLDEAPLEVPWDHRLDLKLIPASGLGQVDVARGPLSNRYGPNISGGAIFLGSRDGAQSPGRQLGVEAGTEGSLRLTGSLAGSLPETSLSASLAAEHTEADGQPLAEALPFSQPQDELRTNTDFRRTSVIGSGRLFLGDFELRGTAFYGHSELGVAPESHLDPSVEPVRYWRYPDSEMAMVIGGLHTSGADGALDAVLWGQAFDQTIESYASARYQTLEERQRDNNRSLGTRLRVVQQLGAHQLSGFIYGSLSQHEERRSSSPQERLSEVPAETYLTGLWSAGGDYKLTFGQAQLRIGGGVDTLELFETAGRPSKDRFLDWNVTGGIRLALGPRFTLHAALGSRPRLPTPRELFGVALDRFLLNEDLRAERNSTGEVGLRYAFKEGSIELVPFATWTRDTLAQQDVVVDGQRLRQRINLEGSRTLGVELLADYSWREWLAIYGQLLLSDVRRTGGGDSRLEERPGAQAFVEVVLRHPMGLELSTEVWARSHVYSLAPEGLREVPGATLLSFRGSYRVNSNWAGSARIYVRVSNVFNARLEPQLGLPEPGRQVRAGLTVDF